MTKSPVPRYRLLLALLPVLALPAVSQAQGTPPQVTSRESYLDFAQRLYPRFTNYALQKPDAPQKYGAVLARREALLYQIGQGANPGQHALNAMRLLRAQGEYLDQAKPKALGPEPAIEATEAYIRIRNYAALTPADHAFARQLILRLEDLAPQRPLEYGAMNRSMDAATLRRMIMLLYPDAPQSSVLSVNDGCANDRAQYTQQVWNDWAATWDNYESSSHYNGVWWAGLMEWIWADDLFKARPASAVLGRPEVKALAYRYLAQVSPLGIMPHYGDSEGLNEDPETWIRLMEEWATAYHDGQFKWVAHRMFAWTAPQTKEMAEWGNLEEWMMDDLLESYLASDDSIPEQMPKLGSMVTYRHAMDFQPATQPYPLLKPDLIPDKLILRSGWKPDDFFAFVDLTPYMGHGHEDAGAVNLMTGNGSVLLADPARLVKNHHFHNAFVLDVDGFGFPNKQFSNSDKYLAAVISKESITVPRFVDGKLGSYAQTVITPYVGQAATLTRRFFFVKNRFLWVQDEIKANAPVAATIGPAWQTMAMDPNPGENWVNTRMSTLPIADIWKPKYIMQWSNKPWDLLVVFPKEGEGTIKIDDVNLDTTHELEKKDFQNTEKYRVWNQKHVRLAANETAEFNSVLLPHQPGLNAGDLAGRFELVVDTAGQSVLRFQDPDGATWYVGENDAHAPVQTGPLRTDAQTFMVRMRGNAIEDEWHEGGSYLKSTAGL